MTGIDRRSLGALAAGGLMAASLGRPASAQGAAVDASKVSKDISARAT